MILKNKVSVIINKDCFLGHHFHIYFEKLQREKIRGYDVDLKDFRKHIVSALGEYLEREILTNNSPLEADYVLGVNMINGSVKKISTSDVLFGKKFIDSCGMASHINSQELITKAYLEFFERQSLISNYLFGIDGEKIVFNNVMKIEKLDCYIKNYVSEIDYFNISLTESIKVVIAIALV